MPILNSIGALSLEEGGDNAGGATAITGYIYKVVPNYDGTVVLILRERTAEVYERDAVGNYNIGFTVSAPSGYTNAFTDDGDISSDGKKIVVSFYDGGLTKSSIIYAYAKTTQWTLSNAIIDSTSNRFGNSISLSWSDTGCVITQSDSAVTNPGWYDGFVYYYGNIWSSVNGTVKTLIPRASSYISGQHTWPRQALLSNDGSYIRVASGLSSFVNVDDISVTTKSPVTLPSTTKFHSYSSRLNQLNREYNPVIYSGDRNVKFDVYGPATVPALGTAASIQKVVITYGVLGTQLSPSASLQLLESSVTLIKDVAISKVIATASTNVSNAGNPVYSITGTLPAGLSFDSATATISGVPTAVSNVSNYTITGDYPGYKSAVLSASKIFTLEVKYPDLVVTSLGNLTFNAGQTYSSINTVGVTGGSGGATYSISPALPTGLTFNTSTGAISGSIVANSSTTTHTVTVSDLSGSKSVTLNISILYNFSVSVNQTNVTVGAGSELSWSDLHVNISGAVGNLTYSITPALPTGVTFDLTNGWFYGSINQVGGPTSYTMTINDSISSNNVSFTITVIDTGITATGYNLTRYQGDQLNWVNPDSTNSYTQFISSTGSGVASYTVIPISGRDTTTTRNGGLPDGITLDSKTGYLSGTAPQLNPNLTQLIYNVYVKVSYGASSIIKLIKFTLGAREFKVIQPNTTLYLKKNTRFNGEHAFYFWGGGLPTTLYYDNTLVTYTVSPPLPNGLTANVFSGYDKGLDIDSLFGWNGVSSTHTFTFTSPNGNIISKTITFVGYDPSILTCVVNTPLVQYSNGETKPKFKPVTTTGGLGTYKYYLTQNLPNNLILDELTGEISGNVNVTAPSSTVYGVTTADFVNNGVYPAFTVNVSPVDQIKYGPWSNPTKISEKTATFNLTVYKLAFTVHTPNINLTYIPNTAITPLYPVTVNGGLAPYTYTFSPALPNGLTINPANGYITGIPTTGVATTEYTMTGRDSLNNTGSAKFTMTISYTPVILTAATTYKFELGAPLTINLGAATKGGSGTGYTYTISPALPSGLTIDSTTGAIGGTATAISNSANYTITVTDNKGNTATAIISLSIVYQALTVAGRWVGGKVGTALSATSFGLANGGLAPYTYTISPSLPAGLTFNSSNCSVSGTPTAASTATYTITATDSRGITATGTTSLAVYSPLTIASTGTGNMTIGTAWGPMILVTSSGGVGGNRYTASGLPAGLTINNITGGISGIPTTKFDGSYAITVTDGDGNTATTNITLKSVYTVLQATSKFTSQLPLPIAVGAVSSSNYPVLEVSGSYGKLVWSISPALPTGLTLNTSTGIITGTLGSNQGSGIYNVTVSDLTSNLTVVGQIVLNVFDRNASSVINKSAILGIATTIDTFKLTSMAASYSIFPTLPTGLTFNNITGVVSGTSTTKSSSTPYRIVVIDSYNTYTGTLNLSVNTILTATSRPNTFYTDRNNDSVIYAILTGGSGGYTFTLNSVLPAGLSFDAQGIISGQPTLAGSYTIKWTVTAGDGQSLTNSSTLIVYDPFIVTGGTVILYIGDTAATNLVSISGGSKTYSVQLVPSKPAGISMINGVALNNTTGALTGLIIGPASTSTLSVSVTDLITNFSTTVSVTIQVRVKIYLSYNATNYLTTSSVVSIKPQISGGILPYTYTISPALPTGLNISSSTGAIAGVATVTNPLTTYNITVTDANKDSKTVTTQIGVYSANIKYTQTTYNTTQGVSISIPAPIVTASAGSGSGPYYYSITPALPSVTGLTINRTTGAISGLPVNSSATPLPGNIFTYTVFATDSITGLIIATTINISILTITLSLKQILYNPYRQIITCSVVGGTPGYTYSISAGVPGTNIYAQISPTGEINLGSDSSSFGTSLNVANALNPVKVTVTDNSSPRLVATALIEVILGSYQ
jgi:hypothetical protein